MTQGRQSDTASLFNLSRDFCDRILPAKSIYRLLYDQGDVLFPDEFFDDLYSGRGRASVPPRIVASAMVLQRLEGLSDRETVDRLTFDLRWKFACGGLDADYPAFVHTVLVNMRARLRKSDSPTRIFEAVLGVAKEAGLVGSRRVLDSTPLYDAVATQDTVTLLRSGIRGVLRSCDAATERRVRDVLKRDDSYDSPGKPVCDWNDAEAREQLVDALAQDGYAVLAIFDGETLASPLDESVRLLATLLGQDLEEGDDGTFRIARRVARDRVISTVDPEARHGHKTSSRKFDGYKGHVAIDPDSEIVTATVVTAGNVGDGEVAEELIGDLLPADEPSATRTVAETEGSSGADALTNDVSSEVAQLATSNAESGSNTKEDGLLARLGAGVKQLASGLLPTAWFGTNPVEGVIQGPAPPTALPSGSGESPLSPSPVPAVFGDASYGGATVLAMLDGAGIDVYTKVQPPASRGGRYAQDRFSINLDANEVTCPAGKTVPLRVRDDGSGRAAFGKNCADCPLREQCTTAKSGRTVNVHAEFERLDNHRAKQRDPGWKADYKATRPKVERKIGHMVRRKHGGRRARVRGTERIGLDFSLLAAAINLARFAQLGLTRNEQGWAVPI